LDILTAEGLPADRVIIGHCDTVPMPAYHAEIAARGAYVQFDTFHRCTDEREIDARVDYIAALAAGGVLDRVLVSHDLFLAEHLAANGGTGLGFIPRRLPDLLLTAGLTVAQVDRILITNPARALAG
jgi:phosphotriesterase-related protein